MTNADQPERFRARRIRFANGAEGQVVEVPSANPSNHHAAMIAAASAPPVVIDGQLFLPPGASGPVPVVMVVPGSLSVAPSHLAHAEHMTDLGLAAFVLDPFGARGVTSTVANQAQFSFAASAYDVLMAARVLALRPEIDARRIGAQGHSRGGAAVLGAAAAHFADAVLPGGPRLHAVYAAYPWSGQQFLNPSVGATIVRAIIGDRDEWCLPQQVQGHVQAMRLAGGDASLRMVADAQHSFDRGPPVWRIDDARVSPSAPTTYIADDGAYVHPASGAADPALTDRDLWAYHAAAGYGVSGASIGGTDEQARLFHDDMSAFWRAAMAR